MATSIPTIESVNRPARNKAGIAALTMATPTPYSPYTMTKNHGTRVRFLPFAATMSIAQPERRSFLSIAPLSARHWVWSTSRASTARRTMVMARPLSSDPAHRERRGGRG